MSERDNLLDKIIGRSGVAAKLRGAAQGAKQELDAAGVEHKSIKGKALMEELQAEIDAVLAKVSDSVPEGTSAELLQMVINKLGAAQAAPAAEPEADVEAEAEAESDPLAEALGMAEMAAGEDDEESLDIAMRAARTKQVQLIAALIESQEAISGDVEQVAKSVEKLPDMMMKLAQRLDKVEKQLAGRPRQASQSDASLFDDDSVALSIKQRAVKADAFWNTELAE